MNLSPLQKARYDYQPKLPGMLRNGISRICVKEGEATKSVADQDKISKLFPNTYGKKLHSKKAKILHLQKNKSLVLFCLVDKLLEDTTLFQVYMMH